MKEDLQRLIQDAGLTPGEAKIYLALLKLGSSTTGPIVETSGVNRSIVYVLLENLKKKGLASSILKDKTKYYQAAQPQKIVDYIEERKAILEKSKDDILHLIPSLTAMYNTKEEGGVNVFQGFKGVQSAWEYLYTKLKRGDEYHCWGVYPIQAKKYHLYWQRDHVKRSKLGIKGKILFNQGTPRSIVENRNSYAGVDARYMPSPVKTPAWFMVYKNVTMITVQDEKEFAILIENDLVARSFEAYFKDFWDKSKKYAK